MGIDTTIRHYIAATQDRLSTRAHWPDRYSGAYLGMGGRDPVFTGPEHAALVIGPPRAGKTSAIVVPAVTLWDGPVVATSTKPDTLYATNSVRQRYGRTWVLDPVGTLPLPAGAHRLAWSPLQGCARWEEAIDRAWMLTYSARPDPTGDALHWTERAAALLSTLLHAAAIGALPFSTLLRWVHLRETWTALDHLSQHPGSQLAHHLLTGIAQTDSRELSGIWSTADSVLAAYRNPTLLAGADQPNFDPAAFARSTDTVHIISPGPRAGLHAPIVCALLDQIRQHCLTARHRPMLWALDELANIAPLPNLPSIVADSGSQGLLVLACLQDLSQARHRWGSQADGLLTLFATTLLLPGIADPATLRTVTTLAGRVDRPQYSVTATGLLRRQRTTSTRLTPLLPESVIAHGRARHALHLRATQPSWLRLTPWHQTPWLSHRLQGGIR
jgi:type IV secretion system protein VirD4